MTRAPKTALSLRLQEAYDKVKLYPENDGPAGFMNLLELRNLVPKAIAALAARPQCGVLTAQDPDGYNGCYRQAIAALNYLAQYPRPVGGQSQFNAEHLLQIADEMKRSRPSPSLPSAEGK